MTRASTSDVHLEAPSRTRSATTSAAHGWLYAEGDAQHYDRARALFPADVLAWVQDDAAQGLGDPEQEPRRRGAQTAC